MPKNASKPSRNSIGLFPPAGWSKNRASRLPKFRPHELNDIAENGKVQPGTPNIDTEFVLNLRRKNEQQIEQLLHAIGYDPTHPDVWRRAFFMLAVIHHGVGHLSWALPRGANRHTAKWTDDHDLAFYAVMLELLEKA